MFYWSYLHHSLPYEWQINPVSCTALAFTEVITYLYLLILPLQCYYQQQKQQKNRKCQGPSISSTSRKGSSLNSILVLKPFYNILTKTMHCTVVKEKFSSWWAYSEGWSTWAHQFQYIISRYLVYEIILQQSIFYWRLSNLARTFLCNCFHILKLKVFYNLLSIS